MHPTAIVEDGVEIGPGTSVWSHVHIRGPARIGADCIIGEKTYIAYDVDIGDRVKINAFVYICAGVTIEDGVMISAGTVFTNDRFPRATMPDLSQLAAVRARRAHSADARPRGRDDRRRLRDRLRSDRRTLEHGGDGIGRDPIGRPTSTWSSAIPPARSAACAAAASRSCASTEALLPTPTLRPAPPAA